MQGIQHARGARGLNAVDFHARIHLFDGKCDAGNESAATHGNDDGVHVFELGQDFQADRSLPGNDVFVVKGVDKGQLTLFLKLQRAFIGVVVDAGHKAELRSVAARCLHF